MAESYRLLLRRGLKANLPTLADGEIVFTTDEKRPYIGSSLGNQAISLLSETNAKYTKPSTGIPESDLATAVRTKLNKGETALTDAKTYVDDRINDLLDGASSDLDTLRELGEAIQSGDSAHTALVNEVASKTNQTDFDSHKNNQNNPHNVTKEQVGLNNVDNTSDLDKPISTATQVAINNIIGDTSDVDTKLDNHIADSIAHLTLNEHDKLTNIEDNANNYVLPIGDNSTLGGIKIGENIKRATDGTISVDNGDLNQKGLVQLNSSLVANTTDTAATSSTVYQLNDNVTILNNQVTNIETLAQEAKTESANAAHVVEEVYAEFEVTMDKIDDALKNDANMELIEARNGEPKLKDRLNKIDLSIANIDLSGAVNDSKQYTDTQINTINNTITTKFSESSQALDAKVDSINNTIETKENELKQHIDTSIQNIEFDHISGGTF